MEHRADSQSRHRRSLSALAGIVFLATAFGGPTMAHAGSADLPKVGPGWTKPHTVLDPSRDAQLTGLATDGRRTVVAAWDAGTEIAFLDSAGPIAEASIQPERSQIAIKERGSRRFDPPITLSPHRQGSCTRVAMFADGSGIVVWQAKRDTRIVELVAGEGLGAEQAIDVVACPRLSATRNGHALLTWNLFDPDTDESTVMASLREPGGEFSAPEIVVEGRGVGHDSAIGSTGHAVVAWEKEQNRPFVARVREPGGGFGPRETIPRTRWATHDSLIDVDSDGTVIFLKGGGANLVPKLVASYRPAGGSFSPAKRITTRGDGAFASLATDERGRAIATWTEFTPRGFAAGVQAAIKPRGGEFKKPQRISQREKPSTVEGIAMNGRGDALVVMNRLGRRAFVDAAYRPIGDGWQRQRRVSRRSGPVSRLLADRG